MTKRLIHVAGCDDVTPLVTDLTDAEYAVIQRIAREVTALGGGCQPTISTATDGEPHHGWPDDYEEDDLA